MKWSGSSKKSGVYCKQQYNVIGGIISVHCTNQGHKASECSINGGLVKVIVPWISAASLS